MATLTSEMQTTDKVPDMRRRHADLLLILQIPVALIALGVLIYFS